MQQAPSVRRALYVLFARLLAGPPDAALYARLRARGLHGFARLQGVDLTSDLIDEEDAETSAAELAAEYDRLTETVSLRASDHTRATRDPVVAIDAYLCEHRLVVDAAAGLPPDHLSVALGIMGELAAQADSGSDEAGVRARAFFVRHLMAWAPQALADLSERADRRFYRGLSAMLSAFLGSERRHYRSA